MDLWKRMITGIADTFCPRNLADDELLEQMNMAIQERQSLWNEDTGFLDPAVVSVYQEKWKEAYYVAKRKLSKKSFFIGTTERKIRSAASKFIAVYDNVSKELQDHNDQIISERIESVSAKVQPVEGRMLDEQQLRCIVKEARNHLVLAGAGTGKTTTIIGYVKYLLKSGKCRVEDILVLSFTNASATEMSQRLVAELGYSMDASTFHKLGLDIITAVQKKKPKIYSKDIRQFVKEQLAILMQNPTYLQKLVHYLMYHGSQQKSEFDFKTNEEYQRYLKYNPPITLKKEPVKSYGEVDIANYLTQNGVRYEYEKEYPVDTRTEVFGQYHPDFYLPDFDLYIEYFGINRNGEVPAYFLGKNGKSGTQIYQEGMQWKRELHRKNGTRLVEVYGYEKLEEQLLVVLEERLKKAGVIFHPRSPKEVWDEIGGSDNQKIDRIAELFSTVITLIKSNNCSIDAIRLRNRQYCNWSSIDMVLDLIVPVYDNYQKILQENGEIDFNDMINLAVQYVREGKYRHHYQYVIVDEYQDISQARFRLLETLRHQTDYRLFCVGDDWQSIYRFCGSDIGFILNFEKYWGASEVSRIETTYRFSQSLIEVSGNFIMQNPDQKRKKLKSAVDTGGFAVEKIVGYTDTYAVEFIAERLNDLPKNSSVLFLGRYRFDIRMLDGNRQFSYRYNAVTGKIEVSYTR